MFLNQPARAARDEEKHEKKSRGGNGGHAELPAPFRAAKAKQADDVVGEVGEENSEDHVELKETDEAAAPLGGRDFRNVHGAEDGRAADGQAANDAEADQRGPVPSEGAADGGNHVKHGHDAETVAAAVSVAGNSCGHGADDGAEDGAENGDAESEGSETIQFGEGVSGAGDDRGVKTKKQTAERGDEGASQEIGIQVHFVVSKIQFVTATGRHSPVCPPLAHVRH